MTNTQQAARRPARQRSKTASRDVAATLASWGLTPKLVERDRAVYDLLAAEGPLTEADLAAKLGDGYSAWSLRRLATATHRGVTHGSPLVSVTGRGKDRAYQVAS